MIFVLLLGLLKNSAGCPHGSGKLTRILQHLTSKRDAVDGASAKVHYINAAFGGNAGAIKQPCGSSHSKPLRMEDFSATLHFMLRHSRPCGRCLINIKTNSQGPDSADI